MKRFINRVFETSVLSLFSAYEHAEAQHMLMLQLRACLAQTCACQCTDNSVAYSLEFSATTNFSYRKYFHIVPPRMKLKWYEVFLTKNFANEKKANYGSCCDMYRHVSSYKLTGAILTVCTLWMEVLQGALARDTVRLLGIYII